jgi:hypothetical protein
VPGLIDGRRKVSAIVDALAGDGASRNECANEVRRTIQRLAGMGAIERVA